MALYKYQKEHRAKDSGPKGTMTVTLRFKKSAFDLTYIGSGSMYGTTSSFESRDFTNTITWNLNNPKTMAVETPSDPENAALLASQNLNFYIPSSSGNSKLAYGTIQLSNPRFISHSSSDHILSFPITMTAYRLLYGSTYRSVSTSGRLEVIISLNDDGTYNSFTVKTVNMPANAKVGENAYTTDTTVSRVSSASYYTVGVSDITYS